MIQYFDAHCDTISTAYERGCNIFGNDLHVDITRARAYKPYAGVFAIWQDDAISESDAYDGFMRLYDFFMTQIAEYEQYIGFCKTKADYTSLLESGRIPAILSMEGAAALCGDIRNVDLFHKMGVRLITLTWNHDNALCGGIGGESQTGLTRFGREVVTRMGELDMLIDVSHISRAGFDDVIECARGIVVASHSNSHYICPHRRNLSDSQFKALISTGGGAGINLYADFVREDGEAEIADVIAHIEHFCSLGGRDGIFIGADFDGFDKPVLGLENMSKVYVLYNELLKLNYAESLTRKIFFGNLERIIAASLC